MRVLHFPLRVSALALAANECHGFTLWTEMGCGDTDGICMLPLLFSIVMFNVHRVPVACQLCYSSKREEKLPQLWANEFHEFFPVNCRASWIRIGVWSLCWELMIPESTVVSVGGGGVCRTRHDCGSLCVLAKARIDQGWGMFFIDLIQDHWPFSSLKEERNAKWILTMRCRHDFYIYRLSIEPLFLGDNWI